MNPSIERILGYMHKETLQLVRDPSSILIAAVLPFIMIMLFGFAVSLDTNVIKIGLYSEDNSTEARSLSAAFQNTPYFDVTVSQNKKELQDDMVAGHIRAVVAIPQDFSKTILAGRQAGIQVVADGSETNTASFVQAYADGTVATWISNRQYDQGKQYLLPINFETRTWFNSELKSRNTILPGSIAIIMSMIGCLLTALVVAREWERGTMEAMIATPIRVHEILIAKITPYFILGLISMTLCVCIALFFFDIPLRGSVFLLYLSTAVFLIAGLSQGLLISTVAKSQFVASQIALMTAFLPAFMLSGFLFEINSIPLPIRILTYIFPPRYFVSILQTTFAAGNVWPLFIKDLLSMSLIAMILLMLTAKRIVKRLE